MLRDRLEYLAFSLLALAVRALPVSLMRGVARSCGRLVFRLGGRRRGWALENARIAMPAATEVERRSIVRESYANLGLNLVDMVRSERWSDEEVRARVEYQGFEHIERALADGRGVFLVSAHLGNFELGVRSLGAYGLPLLIIARPLRNQLLYDRLALARTHSDGVDMIERDRAAVPMLRAIKRNRCVGVLLDQYSRRRRGVFVPLFGARCSTSAGVATIALRAEAPVLCLSVRRIGPDRHLVEVSPPISVERTGDRKADIESATAAYLSALEKRILSCPEQWMWGHRRFRHSPDLDFEPYVS